MSPSLATSRRTAGFVRLPHALCLFVLVAGAARAQAPTAPAPRDYSACALAIIPAWNGLMVARVTGERVANLNFFLPRDIVAALRGPEAGMAGADSAAAHARRAVIVRRGAAALTDAGLLLGALGAASVLHAGRLRRRDAGLIGAGGAALALSIPLQFRADGELSRAVWWHNLRFAR